MVFMDSSRTILVIIVMQLVLYVLGPVKINVMRADLTLLLHLLFITIFHFKLQFAPQRAPMVSMQSMALSDVSFVI